MNISSIYVFILEIKRVKATHYNDAFALLSHFLYFYHLYICFKYNYIPSRYLSCDTNH